MSNPGSSQQVSMALAQALSLLEASHNMYQGVLSAFRENVDSRGEADIPSLLERMNKELTGFASRDVEIRKLLARFGD